MSVLQAGSRRPVDKKLCPPHDCQAVAFSGFDILPDCLCFTKHPCLELRADVGKAHVVQHPSARTCQSERHQIPWPTCLPVARLEVVTHMSTCLASSWIWRPPSAILCHTAFPLSASFSTKARQMREHSIFLVNYVLDLLPAFHWDIKCNPHKSCNLLVSQKRRTSRLVGGCSDKSSKSCNSTLLISSI
eukprot:178929-Amphidinium_carterae.1